MRDTYSDERKERVSLINKGKTLPDSVRTLMREKALSRSDEVKNKYRLASSKPVTLYNEDGSVYMKFEGVRLVAKHFGCDHKTINKYIASGERRAAERPLAKTREARLRVSKNNGMLN